MRVNRPQASLCTGACVCVSRAHHTRAGLACLRSAHPHLTGPGAPPRWSSRPGEPFAGLPKCFEGAGQKEVSCDSAGACKCPARPRRCCTGVVQTLVRPMGRSTCSSACSCKPCAFGVRGQAVARLSTSALLACVCTDAPECSSSACTQVPLHVLWCVAKRACLVPLVQVGEDGVLTEEPLNQRLAVAGGSCP